MIDFAKKVVARLLPTGRHTPDDEVLRGETSPSIATINQFLNTYRFASVLPYELYDPVSDVYDLGTEGFGFVLECLPLAGANDTVATVLANLYTVTVPEGTGIQVCLWGSPNILPRLRSWAERRISDPDDVDPVTGRAARHENVFRRLSRRRMEYLLSGARHSLFSDKPYVVRNFRSFISVTFPGRADGQMLSRLLMLRDGYISTLGAAGIQARPLPPEGLINLLDEILNPGGQRRVPLNYDEGRLIKDQVISASTRTTVGRDGMVMGDAAVRCYSVRSYPQQWPLWNMNELIGDSFQPALQIPCPFLLTLGVSVPRQDDVRRAAKIKGARATQNADSQMARYMPSFSEQKKDWDMMLRAIDDGHGGVKLYHQLVTFAPLAQANFTEHAVKALYTSKGWELQNDSGVQVQGLLGALPLTLGKGLATEMGQFGRLSSKTTRNAANMMPVVGEWLGTGTPTLMLLGRRGQIQFIDIFDKLGQGGNYNVAIAARSGSGKSVLLNELVFSYRGTDSGRGPGRVWIIDVGRSFERTCRLAGGQFIEFSEKTQLCLNPFTYLNDDNEAAFTEQINELKPIVAQMAAPSRRTDDLENAWIEQAVHAAWESRRNHATISDISAWLQQHEHPRARELGQMLYPYTQGGVHGRFFEGEANLEFENDFIVLELEELKGKTDLQAVVLQTVMSRINQAIYLGREDGRRKLLVIDEAWDLFGTSENAGKFIETAARRIRKYGGALLTATQGVNDYYASPAAQAAFENSDWMLLLAQKQASIEQLERSGRLTMDAHMKRTLGSITTVAGQYAEVMVVGPQGYSVGRLALDPYSNLVYSTTNEDFIRIKELERQQGLSTAEAIDVLLLERRRT